MTDTTDLLPGTQASTGSSDAAGSSTAVDSSGPAAAAGGASSGRRRRSTGSGLSAMLLPELKALAAELGISGTGGMRKGQLIEAIGARQGGVGEDRGSGTPQGGNGGGAQPGVGSVPPGGDGAAAGGMNGASSGADTVGRTEEDNPGGGTAGGEATETDRPLRRQRRPRAERPAGAAVGGTDSSPSAEASERREGADAASPDQQTQRDQQTQPDQQAQPDQETQRDQQRGEAAEASDQEGRRGAADPQRRDRDRDRDQGDRGRQQRADNESGDRGRPQRAGGEADRGRQQRTEGEQGDRQGGGARAASGGPGGGSGGDDDFGGGRRRGRFRERNRRRNRDDRPGGGEAEPQISDDDVLLPVAGILDILDNYAFVRTSGYLTGANDVYVSLAQVRKHGLRRGDAVTGAVRQPREGERRDKYNALVRLDTVNGMTPEQARQRPEFHKLTPLYPQERLRLETEPNILTTRVIDLVMPIGKGQRALIVSPPKAGKTTVLQQIANAISLNNPECHLMVVLVDERPEEVTDMQRSVKGEVIASTFDRPPADHTTVAELSIERAKRLVELGHDVVVLLDNLTRLGRAYNLAAPASGRILSGGVDSTALYPPKRFLGAARNIENGGSLTIIAATLVETGSTMDTVIFEEFKGTGNAELRLDRKLAERRIFPAVDINPSGTRKEEILLSSDELSIVIKLRRVLNALDSTQAIELLLDKIKQTRSNVEFLLQIQKTTFDAGPGEH